MFSQLCWFALCRKSIHCWSFSVTKSHFLKKREVFSSLIISSYSCIQYEIIWKKIWIRLVKVKPIFFSNCTYTGDSFIFLGINFHGYRKTFKVHVYLISWFCRVLHTSLVIFSSIFFCNPSHMCDIFYLEKFENLIFPFLTTSSYYENSKN